MKRVKSFTKDLRRARSFRSTREKSKTAGEVRLAARGYCQGSMFQESVLDLPEGAGGDLPGEEVPIWQNRLEGDAGRRQPEPEDECQYHGPGDGQNKVRREEGVAHSGYSRDMQFAGEVVPARMSIVIQ